MGAAHHFSGGRALRRQKDRELLWETAETMAAFRSFFFYRCLPPMKTGRSPGVFVPRGFSPPKNPNSTRGQVRS